MATTIRHTHSPGPLVLFLMLMTIKPFRWAFYAVIGAGLAFWIYDAISEVELTPDQYDLKIEMQTDLARNERAARQYGVSSDTNQVYDIHLTNLSPYVIQTLSIDFRLYDCPSENSAISDCSKISVEKQKFRGEISPEEWQNFQFLAGYRTVNGELRVVPVVKSVTADKDSDGNTFKTASLDPQYS